VLFVSGHNASPITLRLKTPVTLGRQASSPAKAQSHVDFSRFDAIELGVSREHAQLAYQDHQFVVRDLGSTNGTFLNGEPLKASVDVPLNNADEIRLGQLRLYAYFLTDAEKQLLDNETLSAGQDTGQEVE
jgi:hypothetical protein